MNKEKPSCVITILLLLLIIILLSVVYNQKYREGWQSYNQTPYNYVKTGSSPLNFYVRNRYKKPFRHPYKFKKSFQIFHYFFYLIHHYNHVLYHQFDLFY